MGNKKPWTKFCSRWIPLFLLLIFTTSIVRIAMNSRIFHLGVRMLYTSMKGEDPYKQYYVEYPHKYHFIINEEEKCKELRPFLVLMVPVAPHNLVDRDTIRRTWGKERLIQGNVVSLFFLLGLAGGGRGDGQLQQQLHQESREHGDLLQSDFLDCYKNLTIKTMMMMEWLDAHCSTASYAMKIDSDMFLNVHNLVSMLLDAPHNDYMTGLVETDAGVQRDPSSKWYMPFRVLPEPVYPRYALGLGYVVSLDLPRKLVEASRHIKPLYIEDVHLGFCMKYLGIDPYDPPKGNYFHLTPVTYDRCDYSKLIATTIEQNSDPIKVWEDFNSAGEFCQEDNETLLLETKPQ